MNLISQKQTVLSEKLFKAYQKVDLLIIDEWLIRKLTPQETYNLLEIVESRVNSTKGSMIFCTQYKGVLVTDSLKQYHLVEKKLPGITNANCWAHARRDFADAVKAADKKNPAAVKNSVAYQALEKIGEFYNADTQLKGLTSEARLQKRQEVIRPLVEEFFAWVKQQVSDCTVPPKSKNGEGLSYIINQERYLKVFLENGDVPIDNSASERAIRTFCLGKKNWMFHNTANGASASALVYSISETAKLNNLRPYYYFKYILEYSCAMKSHFRKSGNQMSGKWKSSCASLLA